MSAVTAPVHHPPSLARCIACGYPLSGLSTQRCPECGLEFDPADPRTMSVGRPMRSLAAALASPISSFVRTAVTSASVLILWGAAWLPGGRYVELLGWSVLAAAVVFSLSRRLVRRIVRWWYLQPLRKRPASERYAWWQVVLVLLATTSPFFFWPLRISLLIHRPMLDGFVRDAHQVRPLFDPPSTPRRVGAFVVTRVWVEPGSVTLEVLGGGSLHWYYVQNPGWNHWLAADRLPWWYLWVARPTSERWIAEPADVRGLVSGRHR